MQGRIDKALRLLTVRPFMGPSAGLHDAALRRFSVPPYIVFYKPRAETLAIVRAIHASMDLSRQPIIDDLPET